MAQVRNQRLKKELERLEKSPPPDVSFWSVGDRLDRLEAVILGPRETPYHGGEFKMDIAIPEKYPFEPPQINFRTPIYHPNIDGDGRICLDILKMPPKGSWKPSQNLGTVLTSIRLLMSEPNPDDPLMIDIAKEYQMYPSKFESTARQMTKLHAKPQEQANPNKRKSGGKDEDAKRVRS